MLRLPLSAGDFCSVNDAALGGIYAALAKPVGPCCIFIGNYSSPEISLPSGNPDFHVSKRFAEVEDMLKSKSRPEDVPGGRHRELNRIPISSGPAT